MQKLKTNMQKIKVCLSMKQGSVLVYSLIILSAMLFIVTSISVVSITEKKNASSTDASMQSYQTADSGVQLALKKINLGVAGNQTLADVFGAGNCVAGKVETNTDGGPATSNYSLSFEAGGVPIIDCATLVNKVTSIKSVGTYKDTVRAVQVAVAGTGDGKPGNWACETKQSSGGSNQATVMCDTGQTLIAGGCVSNTTQFTGNLPNPGGTGGGAGGVLGGWDCSVAAGVVIARAWCCE